MHEARSSPAHTNKETHFLTSTQPTSCTPPCPAHLHPPTPSCVLPAGRPDPERRPGGPGRGHASPVGLFHAHSPHGAGAAAGHAQRGAAAEGALCGPGWGAEHPAAARQLRTYGQRLAAGSRVPSWQGAPARPPAAPGRCVYTSLLVCCFRGYTRPCTALRCGCGPGVCAAVWFVVFVLLVTTVAGSVGYQIPSTVR